MPRSHRSSTTTSQRQPTPARRSTRSSSTRAARKPAATDNRQLPYMPSRREIARRCREIQASWTPATRRMRDRYRVDPIVLAPVHVILDAEQRQDAA